VLKRFSAQPGFTLVETVIALSFFAIVATALAALLTSSIAAHDIAKERTLAEQAAQNKIEGIRQLNYADVGIPNGNPPGTISTPDNVNLDGFVGTVKTKVTYVSDPAPTSYASAANYKKVVVTVYRDRDNAKITQEVTYVTPPGHAQFGGINQAIIDAQVVDMGNNTAVQDATVSLSTGPSAPRSDTTDVTGRVEFPDLTANPTGGSLAYYDIGVAATGFQTLPDDVSPAGAAHVQLAPGQDFNTVIRVFRPCSIVVNIKNSNGTPYTGSSIVHVGSPRKGQSFNVTGSTKTITTLGGESIVPGLQYTVGVVTAANLFSPAVTQPVPAVGAYPSSLTGTFNVTLQSTAPVLKTLTITVKNAANAAVSGARVDVTGGPVPIFLTGVANTSGVVAFSVPSGTGYAATAYSGTLTGNWSGSVTANTAATVTVR
jgi:type II secretory pathway pseudopilin PulG